MSKIESLTLCVADHEGPDCLCDFCQAMVAELKNARDDDAERHQERRDEDFYGGSGPQTVNERQRATYEQRRSA